MTLDVEEARRAMELLFGAGATITVRDTTRSGVQHWASARFLFAGTAHPEEYSFGARDSLEGALDWIRQRVLEALWPVVLRWETEKEEWRIDVWCDQCRRKQTFPVRLKGKILGGDIPARAARAEELVIKKVRESPDWVNCPHVRKPALADRTKLVAAAQAGAITSSPS